MFLFVVTVTVDEEVIGVAHFATRLGAIQYIDRINQARPEYKTELSEVFETE